jgi:DNA mismatch repair protein MutL
VETKAKIRILPEPVVNKIAAGEVVDRPASVIKELMENSLDARTSFIRVRLKGARGNYLSVTDKGWGMSPDDCLLALERHSTSKISAAHEIERISTMGFRGEALPSIAAVSHLTLETRRPEDAVGTRLETSGGKIRAVTEAALPPGTTVTVRQLFYNTPARRKFLRTAATEKGHLFRTFTRLALANPLIRMELEYDGRRIYTLPGTDAPARRLATLLGESLSGVLRPVGIEVPGASLKGSVADPSFSTPGLHQHFFVNGRPVEDRLVYAAVREGFGKTLAGRRRPSFLLFLTIDPGEVDVNVHPTKKEVRFRNPVLIRKAIMEGIIASLESAPSRSLEAPSGVREPHRYADFPSEKKISVSPGSTGTLPAAEPETLPYREEAQPTARSPREEINCLGQVLGGYLLAALPDKLLLIDQHAAHERVLFENAKQRLDDDSELSQPLLWPEELEIQPQDYQHLEEAIPLLRKVGCIMEPFGPRTFRVMSLPPEVRLDQMGDFIDELLELFEEAGSEMFTSPEWSQKTAALIACHGAVKVGEVLGPVERSSLVNDLMACRDPYHCPHGRPTIVAFDSVEMEKLFRRR